MIRHFDLHDTISVMIPGAAALSLIFLSYSGSGTETAQMFSSFSVCSSLVVLALSYILGEFLQGVGEWTVKSFYRHFLGGEPLEWLFISGSKQRVSDDFFPTAFCQKVVSVLKKELGMEFVSGQEIGQCFAHIKAVVYTDEVSRVECIKMLTKANFYSAMTVLCFIAPLLYFIIASVGRDCCILSYCLTHDIWSYTSSSAHPCCVEGVLYVAVSWGVSFGCARRYRFFNIIYNRTLISAYLELVKQ